MTAAQKDDLLKDAIAEATGKSASTLKRKDVQKYRKEAAVDKLSSTFSECAGAGVADCMADAKAALKKSLGRSEDVTSTELNRYRHKAAMAKVAALKSACADTNTADDACKTELKAKIKELTGKDVDETGLQKIVRKGAEGAAREFMSSCGGAAREAYEASSKNDAAKTTLRTALKACRTGDVKEGLKEALGDKDGSAITEEDIIEFTKQGIGSHAATVMEACMEAAAGVEAEVAKCESVDVLKETLIEASGDPLVKPAAAVELRRQLAADAFTEAQEAANDAATSLSGSDDAAKVKAAQSEAKAVFKAQTGKDLDAVDATEIKQDAVASSIADAARACIDAGDDCAGGDVVIDKVAATANGDMPAVKDATAATDAGATKESSKDDKKK